MVLLLFPFLLLPVTSCEGNLKTKFKDKEYIGKINSVASFEEYLAFFSYLEVIFEWQYDGGGVVTIPSSQTKRWHFETTSWNSDYYFYKVSFKLVGISKSFKVNTDGTCDYTYFPQDSTNGELKSASGYVYRNL